MSKRTIIIALAAIVLFIGALFSEWLEKTELIKQYEEPENKTDTEEPESEKTDTVLNES